MEPQKLCPPSKEEINRLIAQQNGDNGFYLLSIFSFIEHYIRHNFAELKYTDNQNEDRIYFPSILRKLEDYDSRFDRFSKYHYLNNDLIDMYSKYTNRVRHDFGFIEDVTLASAVKKLLKFARYHNFLTPELAALSDGSEFNAIKNHQAPHGNDIPNMQEENKRIIEVYKESDEFKQQVALVNKMQEENKNLRDELKNQNQEISQIQKDAEEYLLNSKLILNYTKDYRDYQTRLLTLSNDQERIISRIVKNIDSPLEKDFLIKGGPGTGKTLVLIKILEKLINTECSLLTYTSSLSKYNQYISQLYLNKENNSTNIREFMKKKISTFDDFFKLKLEILLGKTVIFLNMDSEEDLDSEYYKDLIKLFEEKRVSTKFSGKSILEQAIDEVWPNLLTESEYINATYATTFELTEEQKQDRQDIWNSIIAVSKTMDELTTCVLADYAYWKINTDSKFDNIPDAYKVDFLFIDEIQDLSTARIELLSKLTRKNCVMAGDLNQSIFIKRGLSWKKLGYKVQGHTITLKTNYRSTLPIQKLANDYRECCKIHDTQVISESFIPGPNPELIITESNNKAYAEIINKISWCKNIMNFSDKDICIVTTNEGELKKLKEELTIKNFDSAIMESKNFKFTDNNKIRLSTIKYVKGIDTPILILLLTNNLINKKANGNMDSNAQMNCVYACITRAMDLLYVITTKDVVNSIKINANNGAISHLVNLMKH